MIDAISRTLAAVVRHSPASSRMGHRSPGDDRAAAGFAWRSIVPWPAVSSSALWRCLSPWFSGMAHGPWPCRSRALWIASPGLARWASRSPLAAGQPSVSAADAQTLRLIARRTWRFFETFVTAADNMLPPDNFQEDPVPVLAHRTSPTNLGLYLLSVATARDFAWVGTIDAVERLEATLGTMARLARFRGPFLQLV